MTRRSDEDYDSSDDEDRLMRFQSGNLKPSIL